jgi:hypothetical protein
VSLRYRLRPSECVTYLDPPPVEFEADEVWFRLADGNLTCEMKTHFATPAEARAKVEPVLRAWEVDSDLRMKRGELRFDFDTADIIDRSPAPPGTIRGFGNVTAPSSIISGFGTVQVDRDRYPEAPGMFRLTPDAESLWLRYERYLDGREPLQSMAYFCLTVLEANAGTRPKAATAYRIRMAVLRKLGELTSRPGDRLSARKATAGPAPQLSASERLWVEAAVRALIWRLGETREVKALPWVTMSDLPRL